MWAQHRELFEELADRCGSRYLAVMFLAKGSRKLANTLPPGVIESKLITWVLTGDQPDIERYLLARPDVCIEYQNISNMLELVDSTTVKDSVIRSYRNSIKLHHLVYDYDTNIPEDLKIRVRVLTRMIWYSN